MSRGDSKAPTQPEASNGAATATAATPASPQFFDVTGRPKIDQFDLWNANQPHALQELFATILAKFADPWAFRQLSETELLELPAQRKSIYQFFNGYLYEDDEQLTLLRDGITQAANRNNDILAIPPQSIDHQNIQMLPFMLPAVVLNQLFLNIKKIKPQQELKFRTILNRSGHHGGMIVRFKISEALHQRLLALHDHYKGDEHGAAPSINTLAGGMLAQVNPQDQSLRANLQRVFGIHAAVNYLQCTQIQRDEMSCGTAALLGLRVPNEIVRHVAGLFSAEETDRYNLDLLNARLIDIVCATRTAQTRGEDIQEYLKKILMSFDPIGVGLRMRQDLRNETQIAVKKPAEAKLAAAGSDTKASAADAKAQAPAPKYQALPAKLQTDISSYFLDVHIDIFDSKNAFIGYQLSMDVRGLAPAPVAVPRAPRYSALPPIDSSGDMPPAPAAAARPRPSRAVARPPSHLVAARLSALPHPAAPSITRSSAAAAAHQRLLAPAVVKRPLSPTLNVDIVRALRQKPEFSSQIATAGEESLIIRSRHAKGSENQPITGAIIRPASYLEMNLFDLAIPEDVHPDAKTVGDFLSRYCERGRLVDLAPNRQLRAPVFLVHAAVPASVVDSKSAGCDYVPEFMNTSSKPKHDLTLLTSQKPLSAAHNKPLTRLGVDFCEPNQIFEATARTFVQTSEYNADFNMDFSVNEEKNYCLRANKENDTYIILRASLSGKYTLDRSSLRVYVVKATPVATPDDKATAAADLATLTQQRATALLLEFKQWQTQFAQAHVDVEVKPCITDIPAVLRSAITAEIERFNTGAQSCTSFRMGRKAGMISRALTRLENSFKQGAVYLTLEHALTTKIGGGLSLKEALNYNRICCLKESPSWSNVSNALETLRNPQQALSSRDHLRASLDPSGHNESNSRFGTAYGSFS